MAKTLLAIAYFSNRTRLSLNTASVHTGPSISKPHEPAETAGIRELLHESRSLRAEYKDLQQQHAEESLRRNGSATYRGGHSVEALAHCCDQHIGEFADAACLWRIKTFRGVRVPSGCFDKFLT